MSLTVVTESLFICESSTNERKGVSYLVTLESKGSRKTSRREEGILPNVRAQQATKLASLCLFVSMNVWVRTNSTYFLSLENS